MENSFQTSFIPKKPVTANSINNKPESTTSITMVVSVFIFIVMCLAAGGLYWYKNFYLLKTKEQLSASLEKVRNSFDKDTITELETYDKRINASRQVLTGHVVLSPLFDLLNKLTLSSVQYTKFNHSTLNNIFSVKMSGIAKDYKSIALQADVFNTEKGKMLKGVIFSNLTKDKNNYVTFDVEFNVDPALLSYTNNITNNLSTDTNQTVTTTTSPTVDLNTPSVNAPTTPIQNVVIPAPVNTTNNVLPLTTTPNTP